MTQARRRNPLAFTALLTGAAMLTACNVDEVTFGVGNARTEDSFGNPVVQPYQEEDGLRLYRIEIERDKDDDEDPLDEPSPESDPFAEPDSSDS
ncbi:MAG: hypothetical protein NXI14_04620 [bacterium]|nr:hypothetical protein [bacterium]